MAQEHDVGAEPPARSGVARLLRLAQDVAQQMRSWDVDVGLPSTSISGALVQAEVRPSRPVGSRPRSGTCA